MRTLVLLVALMLPGPRMAAQDAPARPAVDSARLAWTVVTYRAGGSIYLDAGTKAGLNPGMPVEVLRDGRVIAELQVAYVSSNRSSCTITRAVEDIVVGDSARFTPRIAAAPAPVVAKTTSARASARGRGSLRGRVGVRYFMTDYAMATSTTITQPALDARLEGQRLGDTPFGLTIDLRANRTSNSASSGTRGPATSTRVYQAAIRMEGATGPSRLTFGRQFATALSPVGLFDGVAADFNWTHAGAGLFAGNQPDAVNFGLSGAIREFGAYGRLHGAPAGGGTWSLTTGAIGSYTQGEVNREFLYLQGLFVNRALSLYAAQEVDYNRAWKADAESGSTTPTSTFATARVSLGPVLSLNVGYDNRRNIRLYRDFVSPDVAFDDSFRQGMWGGAQATLGSHVQAAWDVRSSRGGTSGTSDSWTASARVSRLSPLGLGARIRLTAYDGMLLAGQLRSASLELQPAGRFRLDLTAGQRHDIRPLQGTDPVTLDWLGANFDIGIGRSVYFTLSTYQERSAEGRMLQYFGSLSYRF